MSWLSIVATVGEAVRNAIGSARKATSPASAQVSLSATGLTAFVQFAGPIVRIVEGKGTLADDAAAANAVLDAIATFDPAAVPLVKLIEMAAPAFDAIVGLAQTGAIRGGYPDIVSEENDQNFKNR